MEAGTRNEITRSETKDYITKKKKKKKKKPVAGVLA